MIAVEAAGRAGREPRGFYRRPQPSAPAPSARRRAAPPATALRGAPPSSGSPGPSGIESRHSSGALEARAPVGRLSPCRAPADPDQHAAVLIEGRVGHVDAVLAHAARDGPAPACGSSPGRLRTLGGAASRYFAHVFSAVRSFAGRSPLGRNVTASRPTARRGSGRAGRCRARACTSLKPSCASRVAVRRFGVDAVVGPRRRTRPSRRSRGEGGERDASCSCRQWNPARLEVGAGTDLGIAEQRDRPAQSQQCPRPRPPPRSPTPRGASATWRTIARPSPEPGGPRAAAGAVEAVEHEGQVGGVDAGPAVADGRPRPRRRDVDRPPGRTPLDGVVEEVGDRPVSRGRHAAWTSAGSERRSEGRRGRAAARARRAGRRRAGRAATSSLAGARRRRGRGRPGRRPAGELLELRHDVAQQRLGPRRAGLGPARRARAPRCWCAGW